MSNIQEDIDRLEKLTAVANASLAMPIVTLTACSTAAEVVGNSIGGSFASALPSGGIKAFAGGSLGGATLMSATGGIGSGSALSTAIDEGTIEIILKLILKLLDMFFGDGDDEKQKDKLRDALNNAIEVQNKIMHKIEALCEQIKQELGKGKEINPDKMNEFLAINYAIKDMVMDLKEKYAL